MTRPHYSLRIVLVDPPLEFGGMLNLEARLEVGKDSFPGDAGTFVVEYDLRFAGDHGWLPRGPAIQREKDGRRFVYLGWYGTKDGVRTRFRRLKVHLEGFDHFAEAPTICVSGRDKRGGPACATAAILSSGTAE